jgi:hypothetical protein
MTYKEQLQQPQWKQRRQVILNRDDNTCCFCGSNQKLQVHHLQYHKGKMAWEYEDDDLVTACAGCHKKIEDLKVTISCHIKDVWGLSVYSDATALLSRPGGFGPLYVILQAFRKDDKFLTQTYLKAANKLLFNPSKPE